MSDAKKEHWRQWAIDGMPGDKMRLAEATWEAAISSITQSEIASADAKDVTIKHWVARALAAEEKLKPSADTSISEREAVLLGVIELVRHHPDFDNGGPMADAMDQALRGETPKLLVDVAHLARGLKPPTGSPSAAASPAGLDDLLNELEGIQAGYETAGGAATRELDNERADCRRRIRALFSPSAITCRTNDFLTKE